MPLTMILTLSTDVSNPLRSAPTTLFIPSTVMTVDTVFLEMQY